MQIQLKQREIVAALKMFIASQGINLAGKTVQIEFTSGRKDNGLTAELNIEDANLDADPTPAGIGAFDIPAPPEPEVGSQVADTPKTPKLFG